MVDEVRNRRALRIWLVVVALMVCATAIVGAATRLTGSGLSITEWEPILGIIPPLTDADWQAAFAKYKAIPQYQQVNRGMSLSAFQTIYWWEWSHRFIARTIGFVFLVPFLWFLARRRIPANLTPRLALLFILGGLQGAVGWYMVRSGLVERVDVSQYRLAVHLGLAVMILGILVWTISDLRERRTIVHLATVTSGQRAMAVVVISLCYVQILIGALVAGLKAGRTYNTWPLMDGAVVPGGLFQLSPWYLNLFENAAMVQFNHRMAGYLLALVALVHAVGLIRRADDERVRTTAGLLAALILAQIGIGVWTLLAWVPLWLGIAHQAGALVVFVAAVIHFHAMGRAR
jgi:heme a synthase